MKILTIIACLLCSTVMAQMSHKDSLDIEGAKKDLNQIKSLAKTVQVAPFSMTFNEAQLAAIQSFILNSRALLPFVAAEGIKPIDITKIIATIDTIPGYIEKSYKLYQEKIKPSPADPIKKTGK